MTWDLRIRNIGGIREGTATLSPGVNAIRGTNWQGKSSFLAAIETAMGTETPLTEGREEGGVELSTPETDVEVALEREGEAVRRTGTPYLTDDADRARAALFAFLDETNAVRRAVRNGDGLKDMLLRPLDFENIDERIAAVKHERESVDAELERAEDAASRLPEVIERVTRLEGELSDLRAERESLDASRDDQRPPDRDELGDARAEREQAESRVERLEKAVERTSETLDERRADRDRLETSAEDGLGDDLEREREALRKLDRDVELLRSVYGATKQVLSEDRLELLTDVDRGLVDDSFRCWTCGTETARESVEVRVERLGDRTSELRSEADERRAHVEELESRREKRERVRRERRELADDIGDLESTLADRKQSLERARARLAELEDRVGTLADEVAETDERLVEVESDIKYAERKLADAREERRVLTAQTEKRDLLADERADLTRELEDLRTRKETIARRIRTTFDDAIREVCRVFETGFETARLTSEFDLVVARDGRETSRDALSEGELELLGIVVALAGYEAFDVGARVPVLLLDGLGALADDNLHTLVRYLDGRAEYLVLTAYPEHAAFDGTAVDPTCWSVVSDSPDAPSE